jgi:hypothetical protein
VTEGRERTSVLDRRLDERLVERLLEAADEAAPGDTVRAAVERVVANAEIDPEGTRDALWALRGNPAALEGLEGRLDLAPDRATLALGGALQLASAELASREPDLRGRAAELLRWLEGAW